MEKTFIQNRKGQKLSVLVEQTPDQKGLAFVMHGLGGFKEQSHVETFAKAFLDEGFTVVRFDTTNSFGESNGDYEDATVTNYLEDLEDVIAWAASQSWYQEPFVLSGHSLGGLCTTLYAEQHPDKVRAVAPISPVVSGALSVEAHKKDDPEEFARWETTGMLETPSVSKPGTMKRLKWSHIIDRLKYDLLPQAHQLTMPVLLIVGEHDSVTTSGHIRLLFDALPGPKEFHVVKGAPHTFRDPVHLAEIKELFSNWIRTFAV